MKQYILLFHLNKKEIIILMYSVFVSYLCKYLMNENEL